MNARRLYLIVAACAVAVYVTALWNRFALDDVYIIPLNPLVRSGEGVWRAFAAPYWPPDLGGAMYRPLAVATYALDWMTHSTAWFHLVNLLWHAAASVLVAALARHWAGDRPALIAGLVFAVHPVHVEAVANVVGRAELMAAVFTLAAVWAALERGSVWWSAAAIACGLLSKENAAVAPALIVWAWVVGVARPSRRMAAGYLVAWTLVGAAYAAARWAAVEPSARFEALAPVFTGEGPLTVRLTAVAALADVARLLVFPLKLRVDYSPVERTAVHSPLDPGFVAGLLVLVLWVVLALRAWRAGRKVEAVGLGWIGIALLPVSNLLFPSGVLVAERTLYLPSVGLALALGAWGGRFAAIDFFLRDHRFLQVRWSLAFGIVLLAAAARTVSRVPVWRDDVSVTASILTDSPRSYRGPARAGTLLQSRRRPREALEAFLTATRIYDRDANLLLGAADAAFTVGRPALADSLLAGVDRLCFRCTGLYRFQAAAALARGDAATADSLVGRVRAWQ